MFDFQKEVILNTLDGVKAGDTFFVVDGALYKKEYVGDVYKTEPKDAKEAEFALPSVSAESDIRIELALSNDYRAEFGNADYDFKKNIMVYGVTDANLKDALKKVFAANGNVLKLDGDKVVAADAAIVIEKVVVIAADGKETEVKVTPNVIGVGTYDYIVRNLRLQTSANMRFASPAAVEMPAKGAKYVQFSFAYEVPRHIGGVSVVGQVNKSVTVHTFFVLESLAGEFESIIAKTNAETPENGGEGTEE